MHEFARFALTRMERNVAEVAKRLSGRMGSVFLWLLSVGPIVLFGISAWRGRIEPEVLLMVAFLWTFGHVIHLYRLFYRILQQRADEDFTVSARRGSSERPG